MFCSITLVPLHYCEIRVLEAPHRDRLEKQEGLSSKTGSGGKKLYEVTWPSRTSDGDQHRSALTVVQQRMQGRAKPRGQGEAESTGSGSCSQVGSGSHGACVCVRTRVCVSVALCICVSVCLCLCVCVSRG